MHIAIVGYGTSGQALAALLAQDGHRIEVFERAPILGPVGAGILLQPTGLWVRAIGWVERQRNPSLLPPDDGFRSALPILRGHDLCTSQDL
jgi:flavin-dependent dehydrogenase